MAGVLDVDPVLRVSLLSRTPRFSMLLPLPLLDDCTVMDVDGLMIPLGSAWLVALLDAAVVGDVELLVSSDLACVPLLLLRVNGMEGDGWGDALSDMFCRFFLMAGSGDCRSLPKPNRMFANFSSSMISLKKFFRSLKKVAAVSKESLPA